MKVGHLPVALQHKVMWAMNKLKIDWNEAAEQWLTWLNELDEFRLNVYESEDLYKENMKKYHDLKTRVHGWGFSAFIQL